ncbi:MAG: hypothetical protein RLW68_01955 [Devosia marina]|uniref:hypothetical protein n=1 Tax=Devosia marina TaxID=2683198 RepID=UPI0032EC100F
MRLYHYTAGENLRGIFKEGLTAGDVPTDLKKFRGRIGVWFTTSTSAEGHGLDSGRLDKKRFRIAVDVPVSPLLVRWSEWAPKNVTAFTQIQLEMVTDRDSDYGDWWICFGWVRTEQIDHVVDMATGAVLPDWQHAWPEATSLPGIPIRQREAWHRRMLKEVKRELGRK